jgi:hypothetical protein
VVVLLLAATADAAQPSPTTTTGNAVARLIDDSAALESGDARTSVRSDLSARARRVGALALARPCRAVVALRGYRALLRHVNAKRTKGPGGAPGPPSTRGRLARDAFAVDAGLKQLPGSRRCGGGAASAKATLESRVITSNKKTLRLSVKLPVARWEALSGGGRDFVRVNMDGTDAIGAVGAPGVPAFTRMFAVPRGAHVSVAVSKARGYTLEGIDLMPKQEPAVDQDPLGDPDARTFADKPFKISKRSYARRSTVPAKLASAQTFGVMRDVVVGGVQIPGAQYDPRRHRLRVFTSMDVKVTFKGGGAFLGGGVRTAQDAAFDDVYAASLENAPTVARAVRARATQTPACGEDYLIVTSPTLRPAADLMATVKTNEGLVVSVHEVAADTPNVDVRTFIRGEISSTTCRRPQYVLIVGDTSHVPSFQEQWCSDGTATCTVTSDLSYSLDGVSSDPFADVILGRIPANTLDVAQQTVQKIITYETQLPAPAGDDFYNHATVTSNFDGVGPRDGRGFTLSAERMRSGLRSRGHVVTRLNSAQAAADIQQFKDGTPIPPELQRPATPWTDGRDQVISELNAGRFLFVHRDHGSRLSWANPSININDIGSLNSNSTKLPVVIAVNCSSAGFQFPGNPSFDERLLQRVGGGAVAVIGDTDVSPTVQNDQLTVGYADAMFPQTVPTFGSATPLKEVGKVLVAGKAYMASQAAASQQLTGNVYREHLLWHLLGDPSMKIRSADPVQFDPAKIVRKYEYRTDNPPVGDPGFKVRVTTTLQPDAEGALVTLNHAGEPIGSATVSGGFALITPTKRTDSASLTVTLEDDGFERTTMPVSAPVPRLTAACSASTNIRGGHNVQVTGTVAPSVSGATVRLKMTKANGVIVTGSALTNSSSAYAVKLPLLDSDVGVMNVGVFYDGERKYGATDASCAATA